jgi:4-hydroxybenzoate polyprenyltransferase
MLIFVGAGVLIIYTVDRIFTFEHRDPSAGSERHQWIARHRPMLLILLACAGAATLLALPFIDLHILLLSAAAGVVALAYSLPVRKGSTARLKELGLAKIFLIAGVWAIVITILPALDAGESILSRDLVLLLAERFLFVFAITLPFDIRDRALDRASRIRTIPVRFGTRAAKVMVAAAVVLYLAIKVAHYGLGSPLVLVPAAVSAGYIMLLLAALSESRHDYYFSLLWDGAILVQAVLALFFSP